MNQTVTPPTTTQLNYTPAQSAAAKLVIAARQCNQAVATGDEAFLLMRISEIDGEIDDLENEREELNAELRELEEQDVPLLADRKKALENAELYARLVGLDPATIKET